MNVQKDQALSFLGRLGAQPAVAFYEYAVSSVITTILTELEMPYRTDDYGNIIVRIPGQHDDSTPLALVAHMDHPGFEALTVQGEYLVGAALGGVPPPVSVPGYPSRLSWPTGGVSRPSPPAGTGTKGTVKS